MSAKAPIIGTHLLTSVTIYEDGIWATQGAVRKTESGYVIEDAPAPLGDDVYEAIEQSIDASIDAMRAQHSGEIEHAGHTYAWEAE